VRLSFLSAFAFAFASLGVFAGGCGAALPSVIQEELSRAPRGTATLVFFTDFQCPYCRRTHEALAPVVAERAGKVRVVLRHVPLRSHPDARDAARAAVCVEQLAPQREADYVHALFTTEDLSPQACEQLAVERGVDRARFRACVDDAATDLRIERDTEMYEAAGGDGVPLLFVGRARLDGQQSRAALAAAIDDALSRR
jgi:protein-disulfide isomerase